MPHVFFVLWLQLCCYYLLLLLAFEKTSIHVGGQTLSPGKTCLLSTMFFNYNFGRERERERKRAAISLWPPLHPLEDFHFLYLSLEKSRGNDDKARPRPYRWKKSYTDDTEEWERYHFHQDNTLYQENPLLSYSPIFKSPYYILSSLKNPSLSLSFLFLFCFLWHQFSRLFLNHFHSRYNERSVTRFQWPSKT